MTRKGEIKDLALRTNDGVTAYLAVHDRIFKEAVSFTSLFKNLFGLGVPMSKLLAEAEALVPVWKNIADQVQGFRRSEYSSLPHEERRYFDVLSRYVLAVRRTVELMIERQRLLNEGSKGSQGGPFTMELLRQKEDAYRKAVGEYSSIGNELNGLASAVFD